MSEFEFFPKAMMRTPFMSYEDYDLSAVKALLNDKYFLGAIWLASRDFYTEVPGKRQNEKKLTTLSNYYNRMCFRPTPFGSFACLTILCWNNSTKINLAADNEVILHMLPAF